MKVSKARMQELLDKINFVEGINKLFKKIRKYSTVQTIEYDVIATPDELFEYVVVSYIGDAIAVIECGGNSMHAIFRAIGKLLDGGYYDEVPKYQTRVERRIKIEVE